ncbi:hypothetical protein EX30DRAFT_3523 [Ascodesmis nigricans]|uniref:Uncharacterized protein n=1 Tax=Ascodesmis nigricans TaxID=341454 RepID=A0A4S2N5M7_9PEZI|nr:hypothetical protein EX30DRAFT_3523 [Ascodesmis nigricans]
MNYHSLTTGTSTFANFNQENYCQIHIVAHIPHELTSCTCPVVHPLSPIILDHKTPTQTPPPSPSSFSTTHSTQPSPLSPPPLPEIPNSHPSSSLSTL